MEDREHSGKPRITKRAYAWDCVRRRYHPLSDPICRQIEKRFTEPNNILETNIQGQRQTCSILRCCTYIKAKTVSETRTIKISTLNFENELVGQLVKVAELLSQKASEYNILY